MSCWKLTNVCQIDRTNKICQRLGLLSGPLIYCVSWYLVCTSYLDPKSGVPSVPSIVVDLDVDRPCRVSFCPLMCFQSTTLRVVKPL